VIRYAAACARPVAPGARPVTSPPRKPGNGAPAANHSIAMSELDKRVDLERMRDLRGRHRHPWVRRSLLALMAVGVLAAAAGLIGQATKTVAADGAGARLELKVPDVLRGGLLWRARISVRTDLDIKLPRLILGAGFVEGMQLNTLEPAPESEAARGPRVVLSYPELKAGDELVVYLQMQVNPTTIGDQDTSVQLDDETTQVARVTHTTRVLP